MGEQIAGDASASTDRLEELEQVTREYAKGAEAVGLAGLVGAVVLVAEFVLAQRLHWHWRMLLATFGSFVWMLAVWVARRLHQRRGVVRPVTKIDRWWRGLCLALVYINAVGSIGVVGRLEGSGAAPWWVVQAASCAIPLLLPLAAAMRAPGDAVGIFLFLWTPRAAVLYAELVGENLLNGAQLRVMWVVLAVRFVPLVLAALLAFVGVKQHLALRRLGRRLDALRDRGLAVSAGEGP